MITDIVAGVRTCKLNLVVTGLPVPVIDVVANLILSLNSKNDELVNWLISDNFWQILFVLG